MRRSRGAMSTKRVVALLLSALLLSWPCAMAHGQDEPEDRASGGEWVGLVIDSLVAGVLVVIVAIARSRNTNPHTGLSSRIKHRRARGPFGGRR
jgi:hypothetical protein